MIDGWNCKRLIACAFLPLVTPSCSSNEASPPPCPLEPRSLTLCVIESGSSRAVDRLSATDLSDPSRNLTPDLQHPGAGIVEIDIDATEALTLAIGPSSGLALVEIVVYPPGSSLDDTAIPSKSVECDAEGCTDWTRSATRDGEAIKIPAGELRAGNVVIVKAFVNRADESGTVSWGLALTTS